MRFFEDMLSSSRGAGFIGTLMALVVLVGFGSLYLFVFDEGLQGGKKSIESLIKDQTQEIKNLEMTLVSQQKTLDSAKNRAAITQEFEKAERLTGLRIKRAGEIKVSLEEVNQAMVGIRNNWEKYKEQYRIAERKRAEGEAIGDLFTKSGKSYKNVVIRTVEPLRISFRHTDGNGTVLFADAPDALIDRFQMTKEAAAVVAKAENANAGLAEVEQSIAEIKQEIDYIVGQMKESEVSFEKKNTDVQAVQNRVISLQSKITQYQSQLAAEANKQGVRNTHKHETGIQEARQAIAREEAKAADLPRVIKEYQDTKQQREMQKRSWEERLRAAEQRRQKIILEMQNKKTTGGEQR